MPSTHIKMLDIATEPTYMNRGSDGEPTQTGLTWMPCEFADASQIIAFGDTQTLDYNASTGSFATNPGEALIDPVSNTPIKRGSITIDFYLRGGLTDNKKGLLALLCSRLAPSVTKAIIGWDVVIQYGEINAPDEINKDQFIAYTLADGRVTYGIVTTTGDSIVQTYPPVDQAADYNDGAVTFPDGDGTTQLCTYTVPGEGGDPIPYGTGTVALRLTGDGWQQVCYGCAMTALTITCDGDGRAIKLSATVDCPAIYDIASPVAASWATVTDGPILHSLGSPAMIYDGTSNTYCPGLGGGPCIAAWTVSLNWTTAGAACGSYWSGRAPLEATSLDATIDLTIGSMPYETIAFLRDAWMGQHPLCVSLPFGGDLDGTPRPWGGAIIIPSAYVADGSVTNPDLSGDAVQSTVSLRLGPPVFDQPWPIFCLGVF